MLAQLLSFHTPNAPLAGLYKQLLDQLMKGSMWKNKGLIPATTQIMMIYFRVAPLHLVQGESLGDGLSVCLSVCLSVSQSVCLSVSGL